MIKLNEGEKQFDFTIIEPITNRHFHFFIGRPEWAHRRINARYTTKSAIKWDMPHIAMDGCHQLFFAQTHTVSVIWVLSQQPHDSFVNILIHESLHAVYALFDNKNWRLGSEELAYWGAWLSSEAIKQCAKRGVPCDESK